MAHPRRVKNKNVCSVQITAEQLLRDARHAASPHTAAAQVQAPLLDMDELSQLLQHRRQAFEERVRRQGPASPMAWAKYARWEETLGDLPRATSIWERAVSLHFRDPRLWIKYAQMNMRNRLLNSARNVCERAVSLLPRHDQLWFMYIHMEDMLGNTSHVRALFDRWTRLWAPGHLAWFSFIKFELRHKQVERAREIFENLVRSSSCCTEAWIKYAKFEVKHGQSVERARHVYERALKQPFSHEEDTGLGKLLLAFAQFEETCKEAEHARCILKYAVGLSIDNTRDKDVLQKELIALERRYENGESIESAIIDRRRAHYEQTITNMPQNYDAWLSLAELEAGHRDKSIDTSVNRVREVFKRAVAITPPSSQKRHWQRYIYVWINYALFEELEAKDLTKAQEVYAACLNLIPHQSFSFSKIWILASQVEVRRKNLRGARRILGNAIGRAPRHKLFRRYIEMEMALGNIDRCRILYGKYVEWAPSSSTAWIQFAEMEESLGEIERARMIFELAAVQPVLDNRKALLEAYMNSEIAEGQHPRDHVSQAGAKRRSTLLYEQYSAMEQRSSDFSDASSDVHEPSLKRMHCNQVADDHTKIDCSKVLQAAHQWKEKQKSK